MPYILRKVRRASWLRGGEHSWLPEGEVQAEALRDLLRQKEGGSESNTISMYVVQDDQANLPQVIAALATGVDRITHFDFTLVDQAHLESIQIKSELKTGSTPVLSANACHLNLVQVSGGKAHELAKAIQAGVKVERKDKDEVERIVWDVFKVEKVDLEKVSKTLRTELDALLSGPRPS